MKRLSMIRDGAVGESRAALMDEDGRPVALSLWRGSDAQRRARWGESYGGRVSAIDRRRRGVFLDVGLVSGAMAFVPLDAQGGVRVGGVSRKLREGERGIVRIVREGVRGKSAVGEWVDAPAPDRVGFISRHTSDEELIAASCASRADRAVLDEAFEEAIAREALIPGGGRLVIEPTAALVAIDVDSADRAGSADPETFALDLNLAAAAEALRQIRLRDLGGLIAIDFVAMRAAKSRDGLMAALKANRDPWGLVLAPISRFGIVEASRPQLRRPLCEALLDASGGPSAETQALHALRTIESAGLADPGRRIIATLRPALMNWLDAAPFDWRADLDGRIGRRWRIEASAPTSSVLGSRAFDVRSE
jgi:Ribonuclease G/E